MTTKKTKQKKDFPSLKNTRLVRVNVALIDFLKTQASYGESIGDVIGRFVQPHMKAKK